MSRSILAPSRYNGQVGGGGVIQWPRATAAGREVKEELAPFKIHPYSLVVRGPRKAPLAKSIIFKH